MDDGRFVEVICDRRLRVTEYRDMVVGYYDRVTAAYRERWGDSFHLPTFTSAKNLTDGVAEVESRVFDTLAGSGLGEILDVGCGIGGPTLRLVERLGSAVKGVNIVPLQIEIARRRAIAAGLNDRAEFIVADGMALPFGGGQFDAVTVFESGCHMPDKASFYRECARVLKPNGLFVGVDWMMATTTSVADYRRYIDPICALHAIPDLIAEKTFREWLEAAGFGDVSIEDLTQATGLRDSRRAAMPIIPKLALAEGLPTPSTLLDLGGDALVMAAQAGAFVLCQWVAHRLRH